MLNFPFVDNVTCYVYEWGFDEWPASTQRRVVTTMAVYRDYTSGFTYQVLHVTCQNLTLHPPACKALAQDTVVYYHGTVIPGGAYVVDSSEKLGPEGDRAHQCLLDVFRATLANNLKCVK